MRVSTGTGPLTVEPAVVDEVVRYLLDGVSVNLVGRRGSGRSQAARRVADLLGDAGVSAVRLPGVRALADRPLAAVAVSGLDLVGPGTAPTTAAVVDALVELLEERSCVVVMDDADDLDDVTAGAVMAARVRAAVPVLAVSRPAGRRQQAIRALTTELQPGARVVLQPLGFAQIHVLVHDLLGASVDPAVVARLATRSGGLPGLVHAMVDSGRRSGRLRLENGLWAGDDDGWAPELAQAVEPLLADLHDDDLDAVTLLAVAGASPVLRARGLLPWTALNRLDDVGLLQVSDAVSGPVIGVYPPLLGEYLRHEASVTRRAQVRELLAAHGLPAQPGSPGDAAEHASLVAQRSAEHWQAELAARRAAWEREPVAAMAVPLVAAMHSTSARVGDVEAVVARTAPDGDPRSRALLTAWQAVFRALRGDDLAGAREVLERARPLAGEYEAFLRGVQAHLGFVLDSLPPTDLLAPAAPGQDPIGTETLTAVAIETHLAAGRVGEARALLDGYDPVFPPDRHHGQVCRGLALVLAGDVEEGVAWALDRIGELQEGVDAVPLQSHWYVAALGLTLAGRFEEFDQVVGEALAAPHVLAMHRHYQAGLLSLAAIVAGWQGRAGYARALAVQARALGHRQGPFPAMVPGTLLALARGGDQADVADELWRAAQDSVAGGYVAAGVVAAVASLERRPDPDRADSLEAATAGTDSRLLAALTRYASAAAHRDADALAAASVALDAGGTHLYAVRALVTRALVLREQGDLAGACRQADEAWVVAQGRGAERHGLFAPLVEAVDLSARELEIVQLAAAQMSGGQIATALSISTRTVENHILAAHRKIGVDNREDLTRAVTTWLGGTA